MNERNRTDPLSGRLTAALPALLVYAAVWGSLCSMAHLASAGLLPLCGGAIAAAALCVLPRRRWLPLFCALTAALAALLILLVPLRFLGGCGLFFNRLFDASEAAQRYLYERFAVDADVDALRFALVPCGLLGGLLGALAARFSLRLLSLGLIAALYAVMAYLGLTPEPFWLLLSAAAAVAALCLPSCAGLSWRLLAVLPAIAAAAVILLLSPGENAALHEWSETARDRLAAQTVAYGETPQARPQTETPAAAQDFTRPEEPEPDEAETPDGGRTLRLVLLVLAVLLLLFVPSVLSDRLRKRRQAARGALGAAENAADVRAAFLYALRWLQRGGLVLRNEPYSRLAPQIERRFPALAPQYGAAVALFQQAAYSEQAVSDAQRAEMHAFLGGAIAASKAAMRRPQRLYARLTL